MRQNEADFWNILQESKGIPDLRHPFGLVCLASPLYHRLSHFPHMTRLEIQRLVGVNKNGVGSGFIQKHQSTDRTLNIIRLHVRCYHINFEKRKLYTCTRKRWHLTKETLTNP